LCVFGKTDGERVRLGDGDAIRGGYDRRAGIWVLRSVRVTMLGRS